MVGSVNVPNIDENYGLPRKYYRINEKGDFYDMWPMYRWQRIIIDYQPTGRMLGFHKANYGYRKLKRGEVMRGDVIGLFDENGSYYLKKTDISFKEYQDDCSGLDNLELVSKAKYLFVSFTDYNKNKIKAVPLKKRHDWQKGQDIKPGEKFAFNYGGKKYELEAFGKTVKDGYSYENFSLVYTEKGSEKKQTLVKIPYMDDSFLTLMFIGDLDGDGKPDIILDAQSDYENADILVFLSSTAKEGELLRLETENYYNFDC